MTFSPEQLNFFKFSTVVLDEFPVALRQVFVFMWDNLVAGVPKWDDSVAVRNMFLAKEGGKTRYVLTKSIKEWDCTALFEATIFAKTFAMPDGTGKLRTIKELYVKSLPSGAFHHSVISPSGNQTETNGLAVDQLRLLRNSLSHSISTRKLDKATFDNYIILAKEAFTALGQSTTRINEIGNLAEEDFPTAKFQQVEDDLKREKDAAIKFKQIDDHLVKIESQIEDVRSDVKAVKTGVTDVEIQVGDVRSDVKDVKTGVTDVKTQMEDVGTDVKDVKTGVIDVKTQVEDVGSDVKDVKTRVTDLKTQVEDVRSDMKDVKTGVAGVKTQVEDVGSDVKELKAEVDHIKEAMGAESSKGPLAPDSCIPQRIPYFVGRQLQSFDIAHFLTDGSTRLVDIWGPPGFGKTSVAINVAHDLRAMGIPVFFISLRGMRRKDDLLSKLLSIFAVTKKMPHPQISTSDWLIQCLQQLQNRFVLILDNADDLLESRDAKLKDEVLRFVEEMVTRCSHIKLLVTTRGSLDYLSHKLPVYLVRVDVLDEDASARLVRLLLPDLSDDDCKSIVRVCGQVPLAIKLMCSTMIGGNVSLNELLEEMKTTPLVEVLDNESLPDDVRLKSIINTCFQRLSADERDAFVSLAVFPGSFSIDDATAILDMRTSFQTKKMLQSLERKSLMISNDFISLSYTIHSLLLSFIDERRIKDEETEVVFKVAEHRFYDHHIFIFRAANDKFLTGDSNEALSVLGRRERIISTIFNGTRVNELYPKVVEVLSKAELLLHFVLSDEESLFEKLYDTAIEEAKKRQNLDDERMLLAAKSFGHWAWFTKDHQTWENSLQPAGCSSVDDVTAKMLCYHGVYQLLCGKVEEGLSSLKRSIDRLGSCCDEEVLRILSYKVLAETYLGNDQHEMASHFQKLFSCTANASSNLFWPMSSMDSFRSDDFKDKLTRLESDGLFHCLTAKLLWHFGRRPPCAEAFFDGFKKVMTTLSALGSAELDDVDCFSVLEESIKMIRMMLFVLKADADVEAKALVPIKEIFDIQFEYMNQLLSEDSLDTVLESFKPTKFRIDVLFHLTETLVQRFGPLSPTFSGITYLKSAIEDCRDSILGDHYDRVPGVDCEDLARSHDKIGVIQRQIENYNGAIESHQQAIREREENIGDHFDTVSSLTNIGCAYFKMNNEIEAVKSFQSALELRKKLGVYDHEDTANIYYTLGENFLTMGNYEKALKAHQQALELRTKLLGEHPKTAESLNGLGVVYYSMGKHQPARETFHSALDVTKKMPGKQEQTADSCYNLALTYLAMESFPEALEFCKQALSIRLELSGRPLNFYNLGRISIKLGDKVSAIEAFQKATKIPQFEHRQVRARSYYWLGKVQRDFGDLNGALESLKKATRLWKETLGDHPDTAKGQRLLNSVHDALTAKVLDCD